MLLQDVLYTDKHFLPEDMLYARNTAGGRPRPYWRGAVLE